MLVIGGELSRNAKMGEQLLGVARVLGGNEVGAGEHGERSQRNVGEIADRRRHEIKAGRKRPGDEVGKNLACARNRPTHVNGGPLLVLLVLHARRPRLPWSFD